MATHSSILAWRIPWTEELGGLQSTGLKRIGQRKQLGMHAEKEVAPAMEGKQPGPEPKS